MKALGVDRYRVGIRDAGTGLMQEREWSGPEVGRAVPWLRRMNALGHDVFIRPQGDNGLVLVDDLQPQALERMRREGFDASATIETSPGNFQAWVKLSKEPLSADMRRDAARWLAKRYGGDMNSAAAEHYGRLAGFTNQKPEHTRDGRQPYVLAHGCPGHTAEGAQRLTGAIERLWEAQWVQQEKKTRLEAIRTAPEPHWYAGAAAEYRRQARRLLERYGESADLSRVDWMIAKDMSASGRFKREDIEASLCECSPNVESRKAGHVQDYARRTVEKAWNAPEVQAQRLELQRSRQIERGGPSIGH